MWRKDTHSLFPPKARANGSHLLQYFLGLEFHRSGKKSFSTSWGLVPSRATDAIRPQTKQGTLFSSIFRVTWFHRLASRLSSASDHVPPHTSFRRTLRRWPGTLSLDADENSPWKAASAVGRPRSGTRASSTAIRSTYSQGFLTSLADDFSLFRPISWSHFRFYSRRILKTKSTYPFLCVASIVCVNLLIMELDWGHEGMCRQSNKKQTNSWAELRGESR